jgi:ATP-dependent Clp protease ATP-binding subunit ClpA
MFEQFTDKAIRAVMLAQEEARRLGHNFVGTEQILLGLIGEGTGVAAKVLTELGVTLQNARKEVERLSVGEVVLFLVKFPLPLKQSAFLSRLSQKLVAWDTNISAQNTYY